MGSGVFSGPFFAPKCEMSLVFGFTLGICRPASVYTRYPIEWLTALFSYTIKKNPPSVRREDGNGLGI